MTSNRDFSGRSNPRDVRPQNRLHVSTTNQWMRPKWRKVKTLHSGAFSIRSLHSVSWQEAKNLKKWILRDHKKDEGLLVTLPLKHSWK